MIDLDSYALTREEALRGFNPQGMTREQLEEANVFLKFHPKVCLVRCFEERWQLRFSIRDDIQASSFIDCQAPTLAEAYGNAVSTAVALELK